MDTKGMNAFELRGNAMLKELTTQRNSALDRCVLLAADLAVAETRIKELESNISPEKPI